MRFKRAFTRYYLELCSSVVATPTEAYESCAEYLDLRAEELGMAKARGDLPEELARLRGEIEQDLRTRFRDSVPECLGRESLDVRFEECVQAAAGRRA